MDTLMDILWSYSCNFPFYFPLTSAPQGNNSVQFHFMYIESSQEKMIYVNIYDTYIDTLLYRTTKIPLSTARQVG